MAREILIADANKAAHKAFEDIFKETDYRLIFSENGEDALLKMKTLKPALVIADVTMPHKNGRELCQMFKQDPNLNRVPFVLLGGPFDDDIEEERNQVKADGAITKPLKREPILKLVDGLLTTEASDGAKEVEGEILELEPMKAVTEDTSSQGEEVIELVDIIEEPTGAAGEVTPVALGDVVKGAEVEEGGILGEEFLADLQFPEEMEPPRVEEKVSVAEVESIDVEPKVAESADIKEGPAELEATVPPGQDMSEVEALEKESLVGPEGPSEPEGTGLDAERKKEESSIEGTGQDLPTEGLVTRSLAEWMEKAPVEEGPEPGRQERGAEEKTDEFSLEGMGELLQEFEKEEGVKKTLAEGIGEVPVEEVSAPEGVEPGVEEKTDEIPLEGMEELLQEFAKEESVKEPPMEEAGELPVEGLTELEGALGAGEKTDELPVEGMGEFAEDVLKERGLEEALAEEIEELPGDFISEKEHKESAGEPEGTPDEGEIEFEGLKELGGETEVLEEKKGALERALRELPGEALEEGEGEELPEEPVSLEALGGLEELGEEVEARKREEGSLEEALRSLPEEDFGGKEGDEFPEEPLSVGDLEGQAKEEYEEIDLEGLAKKVLNEEDLGAFDEGGSKEEEPGALHEEIFKEGELEKFAEEVTMEREREEFPEGALAEAIEEFTGETLGKGEEITRQPSKERPIQDEISGAIKELVEGVSAKILPQLTRAIAEAAAQRIEKTVQKIVPQMAEEAIKKAIRRLEELKTGEEFDQ